MEALGSVSEPVDERVPRSPAVTRERIEPRAVFDEHAPFVVRALRYLGVAERDVYDVAQEVLARVLADVATWDPARGAMRTWIYGFCLRAAANHRRLARHRHETLHAELPEVPLSADQDRAVEQRQSREALLAALATLRDELREVFVLHGVEELPMRDVAETIGIPLQTGYSRYEAARRELQRALARRRR
jgi:RNA polymerase sigma-70 factor (ECF subfamily)